MLSMPPSSAFSEEPQRLTMDRAPLTVSVVICAYTEDRWPLLLRSVSSVQHQSRAPGRDHRLRGSQRLPSRALPSAMGRTRPAVPRSRWWCLPTSTRVGSAQLETRQLRSPVVTSWPFWMTTHGQIRIGWTGSCCRTGTSSSSPWVELRCRSSSEHDLTGFRSNSTGCSDARIPDFLRSRHRSHDSSEPTCRCGDWPSRSIGGFHSDNHDDMDMCHRLRASASGGTDRLRADGTGPSLRSGGADDVGILLATLLLREQGKGRGLPSDGRSGQSVIRHRFRGPSVVPWRVQRTATGIPGRPLGCGEGRDPSWSGSFWRGPVMWQDEESGS